jgi:hypothetical protein
MQQLRFLGAVTLVALVACGTSSAGGGSGGAGGMMPSVCAADAGAEAYAAGITQASMDGSIKVSFVDAQPAPPSKGANTWTIQVTDAHGTPVAGAAISVKPFMPEHGHGSSATPIVTPKGADGTYQVTNIELFMAGLWQITFTVTPASGPNQAVVFTFCVEG